MELLSDEESKKVKKLSHGLSNSDKIPYGSAGQINDFTEASVTKYVTGRGRIYTYKVGRDEEEKDLAKMDKKIATDKKEKPKQPKVSYRFKNNRLLFKEILP